MCHAITWIHVLCGHPDLSLSSLIHCHHSILTGYDCFPCIDLTWLPLKGLCRSCRKQKKREGKLRRRQIAVKAYAALNEQYDWEWNPQCMFAADYHPQSNGQRHPNEHKSGTRYDGRYEDEDMVEYQLEQHGLDTLDESSNNKAIEEWLNHQDYPVQGIPELPDTESHLSGPPEYTSVTSRRSFIPVPVRRKTGLKDQPRNRRSQIPVSVKKIQKKQHIKPQSTLQVVDVSERETFVDEMELFDRITF